MTFIQHVTLNTGHNHPSNRFECRPETIKACKGLIEFALSEMAPVSFPVGEWAHLRFVCVPDGRKLVVTIYAPAAPHEAGKPYNGDNVMPLITCGIAPKSKDIGLWQQLAVMYQQVYKQTSTAVRPQAPWLATVIFPTGELYVQSLGLLADFCRCMAWAWVEIER
jgi:hypothetical protein